MAGRGGLVPKRVVRNDGVETTVWVKPDDGAVIPSGARISVAPPVASQMSGHAVTGDLREAVEKVADSYMSRTDASGGPKSISELNSIKTDLVDGVIDCLSQGVDQYGDTIENPSDPDTIVMLMEQLDESPRKPDSFRESSGWSPRRSRRRDDEWDESPRKPRPGEWE